MQLIKDTRILTGVLYNFLLSFADHVSGAWPVYFIYGSSISLRFENSSVELFAHQTEWM